MQKTVEYTNNRVSPTTIELLIRERSKGKSLRQLGQMLGRSHEAVRQVLARYSPSQVTLLPEHTVAAKLGYPVMWLVHLRKEGITNPIRPGGFWLYSGEHVRQIPSLIAQMRRCERCGKLRPPGYPRFCRQCSEYRKKYGYKALSPEEKARNKKRCLAWQKANPEKWKEIQSRSRKKFRMTETPEEERERKRKVALTLWQDPEYRRRQSESRRGNTNALGYRWTAEQKEKLRLRRWQEQCIHYWMIDRYDVGRCIKCGAVKDFRSYGGEKVPRTKLFRIGKV